MGKKILIILWKKNFPKLFLKDMYFFLTGFFHLEHCSGLGNCISIFWCAEDLQALLPFIQLWSRNSTGRVPASVNGGTDPALMLPKLNPQDNWQLQSITCCLQVGWGSVSPE